MTEVVARVVAIKNEEGHVAETEVVIAINLNQDQVKGTKEEKVAM